MSTGNMEIRRGVRGKSMLNCVLDSVLTSPDMSFAGG